MRVFFVGLHYKQNMKALDSRTISGKRIDMIISGLPKGIEAVKTNLFPTYEMPGRESRNFAAGLWGDTYSPSDNDLIFLLGGKVSKYFTLKHNGVVLYAHPSKVMSKIEVDEYVKNAVEIVKNNVSGLRNSLIFSKFTKKNNKK